MQKEYLSAAAEVLSDQGVDENLGLSDDEASSRLAKTGPNKLEEARRRRCGSVSLSRWPIPWSSC